MATLSGRETDPVVERPDTPELDHLLHWPKRHSPRGWLGIAALSILLNVLFTTAVLEAPGSIAPDVPERKVTFIKTRLYLPRDLLTQKAPNTRTPSKTIDLNDLLAVQGSRARPAEAAPKTRHFEVPSPSVPQQRVPQQTAKTTPVAPPAPNLTINQGPPPALPPGTPNGLTANVPPPPPPPDQPFQNVGTEPVTRNPKIALPKATVQGALQSLAQPNSSHLSVNDDGQSRSVPAVPGINAANTTQHAAIELQSDPQGADFRAYLARVLAIVRGNWRQVVPESVHMGTLRGRTVVEFVISRDGSIPKVVTADGSGSDALDRAAVAGLSMSNPLPPLPADYKGLQVRLAFTFSYNMPAVQ